MGFGQAFFFFQAEDGIRDLIVTGVQTCALPISRRSTSRLALESVAVLCAVLTGAWWVFSRAVYRAAPELRAGIPKAASAAVEEAIVEAVSGPVQRTTSQG